MRFESDIEAIWKGAERLLPAEFDPTVGRGATGEIICRRESARLFSDFEHFIVPGLRTFGVEMRPMPILYKPKTLEFLRKEVGFRQVPLLKFASDPFASIAVSQDPNLLTTAIPTLQERKIAMNGQGILHRVEEEKLFWSERQEGELVECEGSLFEIQLRFNCVIGLRRAAKKGGVSENREATIRRWCAFDIAYPERSVFTSSDSSEAFEETAYVLKAMAGKRQDRFAINCKQAARALEKNDSEEGQRILFETALMTMNLPYRLFATLCASPNFSLHPAELRELLYLARAGTRYLRLFAHHRLSGEANVREVKQTIETLVFCSDPLVRAAAFARSGSPRR